MYACSNSTYTLRQLSDTKTLLLAYLVLFCGLSNNLCPVFLGNRVYGKIDLVIPLKGKEVESESNKSEGKGKWINEGSKANPRGPITELTVGS